MRWITRRGVAETLACALAFLAYVPTLGFQFVYDDKPQIVQNPAIHAWRYLPNYFTSHAWAELYPNVSGNYYRPLFLLWFRLNHAMFGLDPRGWHLTSVLCHVAATYMVFALVRRLAASPWIAFSAATLFALHPVHIESVAWVSGVTDPLMAIFLIGSFLAYLRFGGGNRWGWMALALTLFALGLLEKETTVVMGPLVFAYAWLYAEERSGVSRFAFALKQSLGFFALTILYLPLRSFVLRGLSHSVTPVTWTVMALTEPSIVWLYFRHLLFPVGLSGLYGLPYVDKPASAAFMVPTGLLLALILALAWAIRRLEDARLALFACAWIALPIIPVLWLRAYAEGDIAHDRYLYIPSIGFVLLVSLFLAEPARHWRASPKILPVAGLAALALAYAVGTVMQETYWASDLVLYARAYKIAPHDNLISNDFGGALMDAGNPGDAIALYSQVLAREPGFWLSNYNLGYTYYKMGKVQEAELYLRRAIGINAADSDEYIYLGLSVWRQGRADEAAQYVQRAIQIRPTAPGYHFVLAMIRRDQNNIPAAKSEFNLELQYHPESAAARQQLDALTSGAAPGPK
ncbi:MAG: tetratricopeptide repeat protein [Terriglobia bacterium]